MANKKPKKSGKISNSDEKVRAETKSEKVVSAKVKGVTTTKTTKKVVKKKSSTKQPKVIASGISQPLYALFIYIAITAAVAGLSGAHLNPLITAGMMASRRVSAIRGVLYILGQILGAWFGLLIINGVRIVSGSEAELPAMAAIDGDGFWVTALIEMIGSFIFAFFFARATVYKRSTLTYAIMIGVGYLFASLIVIMISTNYYTLQNNFMMNPAVALMYQIIPTGADSFGQLMGDLAIALCTYVALPMVGGVLGFYLSDFSQRMSGDPRK